MQSNTLDSNALKGKIISCGYNINSFSKKSGICKSALYRKLQNKVDFRCSEIKIIADTLLLKPEEVSEIFFNQKVS